MTTTGGNLKKIKVMEPILGANDAIADNNRKLLAAKKVFMINLMASPGAGKTSSIIHTVKRLKSKLNVAVIEGDIASQVDADLIAKEESIPVIQINTGGSCHLDANMISGSVENFDLSDTDLIIVENVGNLVCPAEFQIGEDAKVMILSVTEGHDKPYKYPLIFKKSSALLLNKIDILPHTNFDMVEFQKIVKGLNPAIEIFKISCTTGEGIDEWIKWVEKQVRLKVQS